MDPNVIISPFAIKTESATGIELELTDFFTPAVIVLLLQHLFVTFAAGTASRHNGVVQHFSNLFL